MRAVAVVFLQVLAWVTFGVGLMSPLTPSDGVPRPTDLVIFVGGPVALLVGASMISRRWPAKLLATAGIGAIFIIASRLLWLQYRTSSAVAAGRRATVSAQAAAWAARRPLNGRGVGQHVEAHHRNIAAADTATVMNRLDRYGRSR